MIKNKGNKINKRISPTTTPVDLKYYRQTNNDNTILNIKKEIPSKNNIIMQIEDIRLSMKLALEVRKKVLRKVKIAMLEQSDNFFIQLKKENNALIFKLAKLFRIKINKDFFQR